MTNEYYFCPISPNSTNNIETFLNGHGTLSDIMDIRKIKDITQNLHKNFETAILVINNKIYDIEIAYINESDNDDYLNLIIKSSVEISEFNEDTFECKVKIPTNDKFEGNIDSIINNEDEKYYMEMIDGKYNMIIRLNNKEHIKKITN